MKDEDTAKENKPKINIIANPMAFPRPWSMNSRKYDIRSQDGMSLRDYAAIKFIAAQMIAAPEAGNKETVAVGLDMATEFLKQR